MKHEAPILMVVTDPSVPDLEDRIADAIAGGATMVQYRDTRRPSAPPEWVRTFKHRYPEVLFLVNGDMLLASEGTADGVHMPSSRVGLSDIRTLCGPEFIVGRSVHQKYVEPEIEYRPGVNYVIFGTVFASSSHPGATATGVHALGRACRDTSAWGEAFSVERGDKGGYRISYATPPRPVPVLAIGGIDATNAGDCIGAGAAGVAVIRSVLLAPDPAIAATNLLEAMREAV